MNLEYFIFMIMIKGLLKLSFQLIEVFLFFVSFAESSNSSIKSEGDALGGIQTQSKYNKILHPCFSLHIC